MSITKNPPITNVLQDPIETIMNGDQKQVYDGTIEETTILPVYKLNYTKDSTFGTTNFSFTTDRYVPTQTLVFQMPLRISCYSMDNPISLPFEKFAWADNGILQFIYQLILTVGGVPLSRNECTFRRTLKSIVNHGKSDNDTLRIRGLLGMPITQTTGFDMFAPDLGGSPGNVGWLQNDASRREAFLTLMKSVSQQINGERTDYCMLPNNTRPMYKYSGRVNLPIPFHMLSDFFSTQARLPPNTEITVYLRNYLQEQYFGILPFDFAAPVTDRIYAFTTVQLDGDPSIWFEADKLAPPVETMIKEYRIANTLNYNYSDYEERWPAGNGPSFQESINVQQQYPTEIILRLISNSTEILTDAPNMVSTDGLVTFPSVANYVSFPESLVSCSTAADLTLPNAIGDLRFTSSGALIYQYRATDENLKYGNIIPSAQDYIFANYNLKNSYIMNMTSVGELKEPFRPITCTLFNSELRFIFTPGGYVQRDINSKMLTATNLMLSLVLAHPLPPGTRLQILLKKPAQLLLNSLNVAKRVTWPEMNKDNQLFTMEPTLAS